MAGHIDHGKTALIKALTGIETDRRPEEKSRGITIDIGFAYWRDDITIIDVPGHEKFVKNMVAGVSTIDFFILVIAADDGVMPQTKEHLDILKFFGVRQGIVVINKIDLVDDDWLQLVRDDVYTYLHNQEYGDQPVIEVSATTGQGIDILRQAILDKIDQLEQRIDSRPFRLFVDRSFSAKGFGSIVTGTVLSGKVAVDDEVLLYPAKRKLRVRGIQTHQHDVRQATAGLRAAVNLAGIEVRQLPRGTVLAEPESIEPVRSFLAEVFTTAYFKFKIKRNAEVRVHVGTAAVNGRMNWFEEDSVLNNEEHYHVRIRVSEDIIAVPGDAVLLRSLSPVTTLAGGKVLQLNPPHLHRKDEEWKKYFKILTDGTLTERLRLIFRSENRRAISLNELIKLLFEKPSTLKNALQPLLSAREISRFTMNKENYYVRQELVTSTAHSIEQILAEQAKKFPMRPKLNRKELLDALPNHQMDSFLFEQSLRYALKAKLISGEEDRFLHPDAVDNQLILQHKQKIREIYEKTGFHPPDMKDLAAAVDGRMELKDIKNLTADLNRSGVLISISGKYYLHAHHWQRLFKFLRQYFKQNEALTVDELRRFTDTTRKFLIPLLEYLDQSGYTVREGDLRKIGPQLLKS